MKGRLVVFIATVVMLCGLFSVSMAGTDDLYYLNQSGKTVWTDHDSGFSGNRVMDKNNPHYGWDIGYFYLTGYTDIVCDPQDGSLVFLKNAEDELQLCFKMNPSIRNIDDFKASDGNSWRVSDDTNGYDKYFQTLPGAKKEDQAGKGYLVIRETDYRNSVHKPAIYTNYLESVQKGTANSRVRSLAEGDYEVALDYELAKNIPVFGVFEDYRIFFSFKVRNSNCMVYLYDNVTGDEIANGASVHENGFRIDYKKSRYLTVNVKEIKLSKNSEVYVLDERLDRKAYDGKSYTNEALYVVTVENRYTGAVSDPKYISVGNNELLNIYAAYAGTLDINEIAQQLDDGAQVDTGWHLIPSAGAEELANTEETDYSGFKTVSEVEPARSENQSLLQMIGIVAIVFLIFVILKLGKGLLLKGRE